MTERGRPAHDVPTATGPFEKRWSAWRRSSGNRASPELKEHTVGENNRDQSNFVTVDGRDIMELLDERSDIFTFCRSCTDLSGTPMECRTFIHRNRAYESIPEEMLEEALYREAGKLAGS